MAYTIFAWHNFLNHDASKRGINEDCFILLPPNMDELPKYAAS